MSNHLSASLIAAHPYVERAGMVRVTFQDREAVGSICGGERAQNLAEVRSEPAHVRVSMFADAAQNLAVDLLSALTPAERAYVIGKVVAAS